jgi:hypothetical protein
LDYCGHIVFFLAAFLLRKKIMQEKKESTWTVAQVLKIDASPDGLARHLSPYFYFFTCNLHGGQTTSQLTLVPESSRSCKPDQLLPSWLVPITLSFSEGCTVFLGS